MALLATVVDSGDLLMTIAASFVAGLSVALVSSLGIWGATRYVDLSQEGRGVTAALALAVGLFGFLATIGIIVLGVLLMVSK